MNNINFDLIFETDSIYHNVNNKKHYVMMEWERPLMKKHSDIVCQNGGDILEIGFGMGISANYNYNNSKTKTLTIVENHPQVVGIVKKWIVDKPNVIFIEGDWFEKREMINEKKYDGIFYDAYMDENMFKFRDVIVDKSLKKSGIFSYYEPYGLDIYKYGKRLNIDEVEVNPDENNYFPSSNTKTKIPWVRY